MNAPLPQAGILDIAPYVGGGHSVAGVEKAIVLSANETPLGPSPKAIAAYRAMAENLHRYPDGGATALRAAIAARFGLPAAQIVCGAGSDELITLLIHAYAGPGDEVLYSAHGFLLYKIASLSAGATPVAAPEANYTTDVDQLLAHVSARTKLVFVANPNNPTGSYISADELARLRAGLPDHVLLAVDGAYAEYVSRNDYSAGAELVATHDNVVMLRTFSKIFGLAALRLGWAYCPPAVADVLHRVRGPFNINGAAQAAGVAAVEDQAHTDRSRAHNDRWLPWLTHALTQLGLTVHPSVGNFVLVRFADVATATAAYEALLRAGVITRLMGGYGLPSCLRVTVGLEEELRPLVETLREHLQN